MMDQGLLMIGIPAVTSKILQMISRKTGQSTVDVIGTAIHNYAKASLSEADLLALQKDLENDVKTPSR